MIRIDNLYQMKARDNVTKIDSAISSESVSLLLLISEPTTPSKVTDVMTNTINYDETIYSDVAVMTITVMIIIRHNFQCGPCPGIDPSRNNHWGNLTSTSAAARHLSGPEQR